MNEKIVNAMEFYYLTTTLKEKIRQGWLYWNVSADRLESIAEHIFGCCMLAISIHSEFDYDIDIKKVIMMLALHETEEIKIPDFTPLDNVSAKDKLDMGNIAVNEVCNSLAKKDVYISLITEFNERKTNEAQFAYFCDKLECDLQAKKYSDTKKCSIENAPQHLIADARVKKIISDGAESVGTIFIEYDKEKYTDPNFLKILEYIATQDINQFLK